MGGEWQKLTNLEIQPSSLYSCSPNEVRLKSSAEKQNRAQCPKIRHSNPKSSAEIQNPIFVTHLILGTHQELLEIEEGIYAKLVKAQQFKDDSGEDKIEPKKYARQSSSEPTSFTRHIS